MANKKAFAFLLQRLSLYSVGIFLPEMILDILKHMPHVAVNAQVVAAGVTKDYTVNVVIAACPDRTNTCKSTTVE